MTTKDAFTSSKTAHPLIHYLEEVREYFNIRFPGRAAPIAWSPCYPDLTLLHFLTITISRKARCVLLHYGSSKRSTCLLNEFAQVFKVVKLLLKHPVQLIFFLVLSDYGYEPLIGSRSITCGEFLERLSNYSVLRKNPTPVTWWVKLAAAVCTLASCSGHLVFETQLGDRQS
jgi:hypothetical protein